MALSFPNQLEQLGLSKNEAVVYVAVLELGESAVGAIVEQTGLHKQLIYNATTQLQNRGLMSVSIVKQSRRFQVADPALIEQQFRTKLAQARSVVTGLYRIANDKKPVEQPHMYLGQKSIQQYFVETIRTYPKNSTFSVLGVTSKKYYELFQPGEFAFQTYEQIRIERRIQMNLVLFGAKQTEVAMNRRRKFFELRLLDWKNRPPMDVTIMTGRVALMFYGAEPYVIDIKGHKTVNEFQQYFTELWQRADRTEHH